MHSVRTKYLHPRNIRGQHSRSPLEVNEDNARLNPHFLPYDGLWIASDKVLVGFSEVTVGLALEPILGHRFFDYIPNRCKVKGYASQNRL